MPDNLIGKKLGDYILRRKLATGGMSHIYIGEDEKLGRKAAVKILTPDMQRGDTVLSARFEREARAIAALEHDSIIPIYQFGQYEDMYFLAMRYIEGMDLADEIQRLRTQGKLLDIRRAIYILEQVASALDYAHKHNIIHRDVKPSNVLLGPDDKAYLSDFGLVLWQKVDKTLGTAFGTPRYISPEQATDSTAVVPQSDVYSLAVMIYEILTGAQLYEGPHPIEVALAHVTQTPTPPRAHNPAIPVTAQNEILKALSKDPTARHKTASEFIQAVKKSYSTEAIAPTPVILESVQTADDSDPGILQDWDKQPTQGPPPVPVREAVKKELEVSIPSPVMEGSIPVIKPDVKPEKPRNYTPYVLGGVVLLLVVIAGIAAAMSGGGSNPPVATPTTGQAVALATEEVVALVTDDPTEAPEADPTEAPTEETPPTDVPDDPTEAPVEPTETPVEPTPSPPPTGQVDVTLHYSPDAFALVNSSDKTVVITDLILKSVSGNAEDRFSNEGKLGTTLIPGACLLFKSSGSGIQIPDDWNCSTSSQTTLNTPEMFWFANAAADTQFAVLSGETVAGTCDTVGRAVRRLDAMSCTVTWSSLAEG